MKIVDLIYSVFTLIQYSFLPIVWGIDNAEVNANSCIKNRQKENNFHCVSTLGNLLYLLFQQISIVLFLLVKYLLPLTYLLSLKSNFMYYIYNISFPRLLTKTTNSRPTAVIYVTIMFKDKIKYHFSENQIMYSPTSRKNLLI